MFYTYNPILVFTSVLIAVVGAYTCFDLVIKLRKRQQVSRRKMLIGASFAIGGSIWAMHFVAMLAVNLPITIKYDVLVTLISGLVAVLMTAVALVIVLSSSYQLKRIILAGIVMGAGISSMHYVGMSGIRGNCTLTYSAGWVMLSVVVGIVASTASLWCAMRLHGILRRIVAALIMGISISGVHYVGMLGTTFLLVDNAMELASPIFDPFTLGLITAIAAFIILGWSILIMIPEVDSPQVDSEEADDKQVNADNNSQDSDTDIHHKISAEAAKELGGMDHKLPVRKNQRTYFVDYKDVVSVSADGHYTSIFTSSCEEHFCNYSLTKVEEQLIASNPFLKVHRSHLINISYIDSFERHHDKAILWMCDGKHQVPVSRKHISEIQKIMGI
jgi:NO-binding membrane sensor protein with MHYT domain